MGNETSPTALRGNELVVKTIHRQGDYVFIGGSHPRQGEGELGRRIPRYIARFQAGRPPMVCPVSVSIDRDWRQVFNGTVNGISASKDNSHVYVAGYFTWLNGALAYRVADIDPRTSRRAATGLTRNLEIPAGANVNDLMHETKVWGFQFERSRHRIRSLGWRYGAPHLATTRAICVPPTPRLPVKVATSRICTG